MLFFHRNCTTNCMSACVSVYKYTYLPVHISHLFLQFHSMNYTIRCAKIMLYFFFTTDTFNSASNVSHCLLKISSLCDIIETDVGCKINIKSHGGQSIKEIYLFSLARSLWPRIKRAF